MGYAHQMRPGSESPPAFVTSTRYLQPGREYLPGMRANGYGADVEFDGQTVTIYGGKLARALWRTPSIRIPVAVITAADHTAGNMFVNGTLIFQLSIPDTDVPTLGETQPNNLNLLSLRAQWRKKDNAAWAEMHQAILAAMKAPTI